MPGTVVVAWYNDWLTYSFSRMRFLNLSLLLLAVATKQKPEVLDFLLANGVSADVQDSRGLVICRLCGSLRLLTPPYLVGPSTIMPVLTLIWI